VDRGVLQYLAPYNVSVGDHVAHIIVGGLPPAALPLSPGRFLAVDRGMLRPHPPTAFSRWIMLLMIVLVNSHLGAHDTQR
jgi:hypothetical protein